MREQPARAVRKKKCVCSNRPTPSGGGGMVLQCRQRRSAGAQWFTVSAYRQCYDTRGRVNRSTAPGHAVGHGHAQKFFGVGREAPGLELGPTQTCGPNARSRWGVILIWLQGSKDPNPGAGQSGGRQNLGETRIMRQMNWSPRTCVLSAPPGKAG